MTRKARVTRREGPQHIEVDKGKMRHAADVKMMTEEMKKFFIQMGL